jgi:hypothetical protein
VGADAVLAAVVHRAQPEGALAVAPAAERRKFKITEGVVAGNFG